MPMNMQIDERASEELADRVCAVIDEATKAASMDEAEGCEYAVAALAMIGSRYVARSSELEATDATVEVNSRVQPRRRELTADEMQALGDGLDLDAYSPEEQSGSQKRAEDESRLQGESSGGLSPSSSCTPPAGVCDFEVCPCPEHAELGAEDEVTPEPDATVELNSRGASDLGTWTLSDTAVTGMLADMEAARVRIKQLEAAMRRWDEACKHVEIQAVRSDHRVEWHAARRHVEAVLATDATVELNSGGEEAEC